MRVGDVIHGRYVLTRHLGSGGMGQVWEALDQTLGRRVAIKALLDQLAMNTAEPELVARIVREARIAAQFSHPNAVTVHDFLSVDGLPLVVMEYVDGSTLGDELSRQDRLSPDVAEPILRALAAVLAAAHARGIVHRDIKPANILISDQGRVALADFGVARTADENTLTRPGDVVGTLAYLAPEVADGEPATASSDIWALGATAYRMVEGRPPVTADNLGRALVQLLEGSIDPPRHGGRLAAIIMAMLSRDPASRPTAQDVALMIGQSLPEMAPRSASAATTLHNIHPAPRPHQHVQPVRSIDPRTPLEPAAVTVAGRHFSGGAGATSGDRSAGSPGSSGRRRAILLIAATATAIALVAVAGVIGLGSKPEPKAAEASPAQEPTTRDAPPPRRTQVPPDPRGTIYVATSGGITAFPGGDLSEPDARRVGGTPGTIAVGRAGALYATLLNGNLSIIETPAKRRTIPVAERPRSLAVAQAGLAAAGTLYVADYRRHQLRVLDPTGRLLAEVPVHQEPSGVTVAPRGAPTEGTVYVSSNHDDVVDVIDPVTRDVVDTFSVGQTPGAIAAGPDGTLYVTSFGRGELWIVDPGDYSAKVVPVGYHPRTVAVAAGVTSVEDTVYVATDDGLYVLRGRGATPERVSLGGEVQNLAVAPPGTPGMRAVYASVRTTDIRTDLLCMLGLEMTSVERCVEVDQGAQSIAVLN